MEDIYENFEDEAISQTDFSEILKELADHPININTAPARELLNIPFFTLELARSITRFRRENGAFQNYPDLLKIEGFSEELLAAVQPFLVFTTSRREPKFDYQALSGKNLHTMRGYENGIYRNPLYFYQKYRWQPRRDFYANIVWEKDAGESDYFDFGSLSLNYDWRRLHSQITVGDYNLQFGQQLVHGAAYGIPVSTQNRLAFTRNPYYIRTKTSVNESAFLRGIAWEYHFRNAWHLSVALSHRQPDVTLTDDESAVRSFYTSGLHRTDNEISKRNLVSETATAVTLVRNFTDVSAGLLASRIQYSIPIEQEFNPPKNEFKYVSGFYRFNSGLLNLQGETALQGGKFPALQHSFFLQAPGFYYGILFYYYHPGYYAVHGRGFGSISSSPGNAAGYFLNFSARLFRQYMLAGYFHLDRPVRPQDEFNFLRRSFQLQVSRKINQSTLTLRYTRKIRKLNSGISSLPVSEFQNLRLQLASKITSGLIFTQRIEASRFQPVNSAGKKYGFSFYFDTRFYFSKKNYLQTRWTVFDIPGFDFRIYEFENDLPGSFRNILLNDRGYKWFMLLKINQFENFRLALKYRLLFYPDLNSLGSGNDLIYGNRKQELRAYLQFLL